jgi:hypothetical protein
MNGGTVVIHRGFPAIWGRSLLPRRLCRVLSLAAKFLSFPANRRLAERLMACRLLRRLKDVRPRSPHRVAKTPVLEAS